MYYISSKSNDKYGVTDTKDGVEEFYSYNQIRDIILSGLRIKGCSWGSNEDLRKSGFWSIDVEPAYPILRIKPNKYYRIRYNNGEFTGLCTKIDSSEYDIIYFMKLDGNICKIRNSEISDFKEVHNVDSRVNQLINEKNNILNLIELKKSQIKQLECEIRQLKSQSDNMSASFLALDGRIPWDKFVSIVIANMGGLKYKLQSKGYKLASPYMVGIEDNTIYFTRTEYIGNANNYDFMYQEYDGVYFLVDNASSYSSYKSCLSLFRNKLDCNLKYDECIINSEYKVLHQSWYKISVSPDNITESYAIKLGKSLK